jgi:insulysin
LRPGKLRLRIVSQTFPGIWKSKEKWYDTDYTYEKIPAEFFSQLEAAASFKTKNRFSDLHFPHRNDVIVTNMEVKKEDTGPPAVAPKLIRNDDLMRIWHKKDDQFWAPKAAVRLTWRPFNMTTQTSAKARLFANVLLDSLNGCLYNFEIQGFEYSVCGYSEGLEIHLAGYNSKLLVLLEKLLKEIKNLEVKQDRLEVVKENLTRSLENWHFLEPYKQVGTIMQWLNTKNYYIEEQILAELPRVTTTDIRQFYPDFLHQTLVEVLVLGNLDTKAAFDLTHLIESTLGPQTPPMTSTPTSPSLVLPPSSNFVYDRTLKDPKNVNHCIQWYLYAGDGTQRLMRAKVLLLVEMTYVAFFNQLGSEEQLGYITWAHSCSFGDSIGFKCTIQSTKRPEYLESRIDMFLTRFMKTLKDLPPKQFEQHKATLVRKITRKLKDLGEELDSFWSHIKSGDLDFELCRLFL